MISGFSCTYEKLGSNIPQTPDLLCVDHIQWLQLFSLSKEKWILVLCSKNQGLQIVTFRQTPSHQTSELNESGEIWDIWTQGNWRITVYGEKPSTFCFSYFACEKEKLLPPRLLKFVLVILSHHNISLLYTSRSVLRGYRAITGLITVPK